MPLPSTSDLEAAFVAVVEAVDRSRSLVIIAGAAVAALLLVIGQLIAGRRITRLEQAAERHQTPREDLENRVRRLEAALLVSTRERAPEVAVRLAQLESLPAEIERLRRELAGVTTWIGDLDRRTSEGSPLPAAALAILAPVPAQVERLVREVAEVASRVEALRVETPDDSASQVDASLPAPASSPAAASSAPRRDEELLRVARLERLTQRLGQQVAITRETTDFYAERRDGIGSRPPVRARSAVYVDVFLMPGPALPGLDALAGLDAGSVAAGDRDYLLVRRVSGAAPEWGSSSPWQSLNGSQPTPFDQDVLAAFSATMVNQFFDQGWSRKTEFWLAPATRDVADLAQRAAGSADAWRGVITGCRFEPGAMPLAVASAEALTVVGRDLPLPGDPRFVGVRWLVQFFGVLAGPELSSACVKSLPHDLIAEATAEAIERVLDGVLVRVGRRQLDVPARPRGRGASLELEQLKADALRAAGDQPGSAVGGGETESGDSTDVEPGGPPRVDQAE